MSLAEEWFKNFKNEFLKFVEEDDTPSEEFEIPEKLLKIYSNTEWTRLIHIFLKKLTGKNYFQITEYPIGDKQRIDWVWFEPHKKEPSILIEHENTSNVFGELFNLCQKSAKLKILITYNIKESDTCFSLIKEAIKSMIKINNNEEFLLIIGNDKLNEWRGYVFREGEFKNLQKET